MGQVHRPTGGDSGARSPGAAPAARGSRLLRLGAPSVAAAALTATVALCMSLVAFGNITDFGTNQQFVRHVLSMDTTFKDPDLMGRAIESPALQDAAYVAIIVWETVAALVLLAATWSWITGLRRDAYDRARAVTTVGLVMVLLLFGVAFLAIGGEWFAMWQSSDWNGLDAAARYIALAAFTLLVVHLPGVRGEAAGRT
ncbi:DUF2165 domain-containing protein [Streptomyces sp. R302]|uniref:DUF2165 domain-containing protein n=1 Tax=unclassified Streptomyces TaxID=2593676 RepID=UPI00145ECEC5|nr:MULTISPECIES: DUF2165 domain-containing protein [unclassified Streptomyces]NML50709.1 DUF2165 domain-containing protein [Streptomyces sp. R301]NML80804.1 DUF2165 domain-containing protein [Streptomyces sp. R302]